MASSGVLPIMRASASSAGGVETVKGGDIRGQPDGNPCHRKLLSGARLSACRRLSSRRSSRLPALPHADQFSLFPRENRVGGGDFAGGQWRFLIEAYPCPAVSEPEFGDHRHVEALEWVLEENDFGAWVDLRLHGAELRQALN